MWNVAFYSAETWALRKEDEKRLESFEMWAVSYTHLDVYKRQHVIRCNSEKRVQNQKSR